MILNTVAMLFMVEMDEIAYLYSGEYWTYIYIWLPVRFKQGGRPILSAHLNVETAGLEPKRRASKQQLRLSSGP